MPFPFLNDKYNDNNYSKLRKRKTLNFSKFRTMKKLQPYQHILQLLKHVIPKF